MKIALPCGAFGKIRSFIIHDYVERFYTNPIPHGRRLRWVSGLKREVIGGASWYRIGIDTFDIIVQNLNVYRTISIPILYQTAPLKVVFFRRKSLSRANHPENVEENRARVRSNRAPVRSILKILTKIALPCGAS